MNIPLAHNFEIILFRENLRRQLVDVWERSVRATHQFLDPVDIEYYKSIVETYDFASLPVYCAMSGDCLLGFIGADGNKVEMLFLDPQYIRQGIGRRLMQFAESQLGTDNVDVNEQNSAALSFYRTLGYEVYERMEKDSDGKEYPILKMRLKL